MTLTINPPGTPTSALVLQRVFAVPPEIVFSAWSDPAHVRAWWHPDGYTTPVFELDFRVGGSFRYCIRKDGRDGHHNSQATEPRYGFRMNLSRPRLVNRPDPNRQFPRDRP